MGGTLTLAARANGDWSKALNAYAQEEAKGKKGNCCDGKESGPSTVMVMLDGPYGGCSIDLGEYETVLLVAGGSGVTFTLALLDDLVGRIVSLGRIGGERTRRIEFAWCIRSFGTVPFSSGWQG